MAIDISGMVYFVFSLLIVSDFLSPRNGRAHRLAPR